MVKKTAVKLLSEVEMLRKRLRVSRQAIKDYRSVSYRLQNALTEEQRKTKYCVDNGILKLPANVFIQIERQLAPRFRFKEPSLVQKNVPHIALTDGKERIAILIPLKY